MSMQPVNLFGFGDGHLKFRIKIPANVTFKIGVIDAWGNQHYVQFPANQTTYGLVRNGDWGQASIPVSDLRGTAIDLRLLSYEFVILEENGASCMFALDDIYWEGGGSTGAPDGGGVAGRRLALQPNAPNPFNARTEIRFDLPAAGIYELEIYDVAGRKVAGFGGVGSAGANSLLWDGRDGRGADLGSGVYYYRLRAGSDTATRQMILVK